MNQKESFIENRIRWRAEQHGIPKPNTYFWGDGENPNILLPDRLGKPVLISGSINSDFIIICTFGAAVRYQGKDTLFLYAEVDKIRDVQVSPNESKAELSRLAVILNSGAEIYVSPEPSGPTFCVWNILIMLVRMS